MTTQRSLQRLLDDISQDIILPPVLLQTLDLDHALDLRDHDEDFDRMWRDSFDIVDKQWALKSPDADTDKLIEDVTREAFMKVSLLTHQHEIASYVSDDFELISRAFVLGIESPFVAALLDAYTRGGFPVPPLPAAK